MQIDYVNKRIQKACADLESMRREFGDRRAKILNTRLIQIIEAPCLESLRKDPGDWHELKQDRKGEIAANIGHPYRLIFKPSDDPPPTKPDGGLDWLQITSVTILEVVDYH